MKTALLLPLLLIAGAAFAEGNTRKVLQQTKAASGTGPRNPTGATTTTTTTTTRTTGTTGTMATVTPVVGVVNTVNPLGIGPVGVGVVGVTTTPRTAGTTTTTTTTVVQTTRGPVNVGTVGTARKRITGADSAKIGTGGAKVQNAQQETCRSVAPREYCANYEQANCCEYFNGSDNVWKGCDVSSNLYTCVSQFDDKPVAVCCS